MDIAKERYVYLLLLLIFMLAVLCNHIPIIWVSAMVFDRNKLGKWLSYGFDRRCYEDAGWMISSVQPNTDTKARGNQFFFVWSNMSHDDDVDDNAPITRHHTTLVLAHRHAHPRDYPTQTAARQYKWLGAFSCHDEKAVSNSNSRRADASTDWLANHQPASQTSSLPCVDETLLYDLLWGQNPWRVIDIITIGIRGAVYTQRVEHFITIIKQQKQKTILVASTQHTYRRE